MDECTILNELIEYELIEYELIEYELIEYELTKYELIELPCRTGADRTDFRVDK